MLPDPILKILNRGLVGTGVLVGALAFEDGVRNYQDALTAFDAGRQDYTWVMEKDPPYFRTLLATNPRLAVGIFPIIYKDAASMEVLRKVLRNPRDRGPELAMSILKNYPSYKDSPWSLTLALEAFLALPAAAQIEGFQYVRDVPGIEAQMTKLMLEIPAVQFVENYNTLREFPGVPERFALARTELSPTELVERFDRYNLAPGAEKIFIGMIGAVDRFTARTALAQFAPLLSKEALEDIQKRVRFTDTSLFIESAASTLNLLGKMDHLFQIHRLSSEQPLDLNPLASLVPKATPELWQAIGTRLTAQDEKRRVKSAPARLALLKDVSAKYGDANPLELAQMAQLVLLAADPKEAVATRMQSALARVLEARQSAESVRIFKRRVVVVSAFELREDGAARFGTDALITALREARAREGLTDPAGVVHIKPTSAATEDLQKARERVIEELKTAKEPTLFIFDGHGNTYEWSFGDEKSVVTLSAFGIRQSLAKNESPKKSKAARKASPRPSPSTTPFRLRILRQRRANREPCPDGRRGNAQPDRDCRVRGK